ncbi:MAG: enoyl-CoA hydratase-related protein [Pseudomonadota bacterium]
MSEHVITTLEDGVLTVTLNRPEKKNAMTQEMYRALSDAFARANEDGDVRVLLWAAEGQSFTAGNDLSSFVTPQDPGEEPPVLALIRNGLSIKKPVVAAVKGWCVGIGATMMLHVDFIYAERSAKFKMPFTELGIVPEAGATKYLIERFGRQITAEWLLLSEAIPAERAYEWRMVNEVVDDGMALARAKETAKRLVALPPTSVSETKRLIQGDYEAVLPLVRYELEVIEQRLHSEEMQQVIAARMASRK